MKRLIGIVATGFCLWLAGCGAATPDRPDGLPEGAVFHPMPEVEQAQYALNGVSVANLPESGCPIVQEGSIGNGNAVERFNRFLRMMGYPCVGSAQSAGEPNAPNALFLAADSHALFQSSVHHYGQSRCYANELPQAEFSDSGACTLYTGQLPDDRVVAKGWGLSGHFTMEVNNSHPGQNPPFIGDVFDSWIRNVNNRYNMQYSKNRFAGFSQRTTGTGVLKHSWSTMVIASTADHEADDMNASWPWFNATGVPVDRYPISIRVEDLHANWWSIQRESDWAVIPSSMVSRPAVAGELNDYFAVTPNSNLAANTVYWATVCWTFSSPAQCHGVRFRTE
jgi:hypothetical protein